MEKKIRKISLLCTTAVMACSLVLGAGITALPKTVSAETASMTSVIGKKTDNITVTAGVTKGDHLGLSIGSQLMKEDWSAQIDATFTGSTSISYLLPNMASNEDVWNEERDGYTLDGNGEQKPVITYGRQGNAFSVRKANGDLVATFVTVPKAWGSIGNQSGYMYNAITNTYTAPYHHYDKAVGVDYWADPVPYRTLDPVTDGAYGASYVTRSLSAMCIAPSMGVTTVAAGKLDSGNAEGTLYFDYVDGVLTISSSSYDFADRTLETQRGNGQIIPFGSVEVDLSDGYTIEAHNAPDFGKDGDVNYWEFDCSSSVLLTTITTEDGAFDTLADEIALESAGDATISYVGEKVVDDKNVITVAYGEKLNNFHVYQPATASNDQSQTLALKGYKDSFAYENNKAFTADEDIVVSNGTVSKNYTVDVVMPTIDTTKLLTALTADTQIRAASAPLYNDVESNASYNDTANSAYDPYSKYGTALIVGGQTSTKKQIAAKLNGTLFGNTSITYTARRNSPRAANVFVIANAQGENVLHVISYTSSWSQSRALVYDYTTQKFYSSNYDTNSSTTETKEITAFDQAAQTAPSYFQWKNAYDFATLSFNYDDEAKQMTVTTTRKDAARTVVTLGVISADLSSGYTLSMMTPQMMTEGYLNGYEGVSMTEFAGYPALLIKEINGVDTTGLTAEATSLTKEVVCENGAEVAMGEELTFKSNSVYNFGSLAYKGSDEVTVDVAADVSKPGATVAVVSDWAGTYEIPFTVKTLSQSFTGVEMVNGGFIRMGTAADGSDKGIGFKMNVSAADKALIDAYVGEGKAYASASYGMIIMPYSYVGDYGDVNAETLFGDSAVYTWEDKEESVGSVAVVQMETANLKANGDAGYIFGALTELKASTVTTDLIGVGYVKLVDANGEVEYVVVSAYSDTSDDANNNIRTAFEVAKAVYEDPEVTNEDHKKWLYDNYLNPNGYEVA